MESQAGQQGDERVVQQISQTASQQISQTASQQVSQLVSQSGEARVRFRGRVINVQKSYGFIRNGAKFYFHSSCLKNPELFTPELLGRSVEFSFRVPNSRRKNREAFDIEVLGVRGAVLSKAAVVGEAASAA